MRKQIYKNIIKKEKKSINYQNETRKIALQLKEINSIYFLIKNLKIKKKSKKLKILKLDYFLFKPEIKLLAIYLSYLKIPKYNLYFIYYYKNL